MERQKKKSNFQNSILLRVMRNVYARRIPEEGTPLFGSTETIRSFYFTLSAKANLPSDDRFHTNGSPSFVGVFRGIRKIGIRLAFFIVQGICRDFRSHFYDVSQSVQARSRRFASTREIGVAEGRGLDARYKVNRSCEQTRRMQRARNARVPTNQRAAWNECLPGLTRLITA